VRAGEASKRACAPYTEVDANVLAGRELGLLKCQGLNVSRFRDAPIIVGSKTIQDSINRMKVNEYARATGQDVFDYCSRDRISMVELSGDLKQRAWLIKSTTTNDALGHLPLVPGMKVMVTENVAIQNKLVNGIEGMLHSIKYETDEEGNRYLVAPYVHVPGCGLAAPGFPADVAPILPVRTGFYYRQSRGGASFYISRLQVPLLPSYCYTDYKSQGRSLACAIVDIASARSLQGVYVMLSRVKSLDGLAILRWFPPEKVNQRLSEEMRNEFRRLSEQAALTAIAAEA
jgi:hypothetical protein